MKSKNNGETENERDFQMQNILNQEYPISLVLCKVLENLYYISSPIIT